MSSIRGPMEDDISVIAVIKKGTSGIPRRARYHYIRELPLTSINSWKTFKTSNGTCSPPVVASSSEDGAPPTSIATEHFESAKRGPEVIELDDVASKVNLRKRFHLEEMQSSEQFDAGEGSSMISDLPGESEIAQRLPRGTIVIKQESTERVVGSVEERETVGKYDNGSTSAIGTSSSSSTNGSSSVGDEVSSSHLANTRRSRRSTRNANKKVFEEIVPRRRNHSRRIANRAANSKVTNVLFPDSGQPRLRQRLLSVRRNRSSTTDLEPGTNKRSGVSTMPYMKTRSVTRKMYTVGATYQAPTAKDELEWREWPAHGMHERPVYHPRVGLAAQYGARVFCTTFDGSADTYGEVLLGQPDKDVSSTEAGIRGVSFSVTRPRIGAAGRETFAACMHESLHGVLAYCALVYSDPFEGRETSIDKRGLVPFISTDHENTPKLGTNTIKDEPNPNELEDSSISDETLMEMSSIYKKLLTSNAEAVTLVDKNNKIRIKPETFSNEPEARSAEDERTVERDWLEELLVDTALLYCVATGDCQGDLAEYLNSLDAQQSLRWL